MADSVSSSSPSVPPPLPSDSGTPWGFWPTFGMGVAIFFCFATVQSVAMTLTVIVLNLEDPNGFGEIFENIESLALDGRVLSISMAVSFPLLVLGSILFAFLRKGISLRDYLSLRPISWKWWVALPPLTIGFSLLIGWLLKLAGAPESNEWMLQIGEAAKDHLFVWIGIVVFAPIAEEFLFRGFFFRGWVRSRIGVWGTILLTAIGWAIIHGQYDVYGLVFIFALGIFLGWIRWKSQSLYAPILVHGVNNAFAMWMVMRALESAS